MPDRALIVSAVTDGAHVASMVPVAVWAPPYRRSALVSGGAAAALAALAVAGLAASASPDPGLDVGPAVCRAVGAAVKAPS